MRTLTWNPAGRRGPGQGGVVQEAPAAFQEGVGRPVLRELLQEGGQAGRGPGKLPLAVKVKPLGEGLPPGGSRRGQLAFKGHDLEDPHRRLPALHRHQVQFPEGHGLVALRRSGLAGHDGGAVKLVEPLQAGGQVHRVADDRVVEAFGRSQVADDGLAGVQADAHGQGRQLQPGKAPVETFQGVPLEQRRPAGPHRLVFLVQGGAPQGHDGVAFEFIHRALLLQDDLGHGGKVVVEQGHHRLGVQALGNGGEAGQVGEKQGNPAALAPQLQLFRVRQQVS